MKNNKKVALAMTMALGLATVAGLTVPAHADQTVEQKYVVVFNDLSSLPAGYENIIQSAQGTITRALPQLGGVQVVSTNPSFLDQVRSSSLVAGASLESTITPEEGVKGETPEVLQVEDDAEAASTHDLYEEYQWDIQQVTGNEAAWNLPGGTGKSVDGKDIVVGVIDTGIDYNHPDIKANYLYGKSFVPGINDAIDQNGHGTHVAGSIAGKGRVMGIGPDLKLAAYRVFGPSGGATSADIAAALMTAADDNVDVVNMSLGGYDWYQDPSANKKEVKADRNLFNRAIDYAISKGVTVVGSAGNNGVDISSPGKLTKQLFGPGTHGATFRSPSNSSMIRVASNGEELNRAFYSNYGDGMITVTAPGGDYGTAWLQDSNYDLLDPYKRCLSTYKGGGYAWMMGTSMASPKAAAMAGLIIANHGKDKLSPAEVKSIMQSTATDLNAPGYDADSGFGLINAVNALK
jgi:lantibiotic leader peptide-processing serine protease